MKISQPTFSGSHVSASQRYLTVIGIALASLFAVATTRADYTKVTYGGSGTFISIAPDNPFGAPNGSSEDGTDELDYELSFSFILPSAADDQLPANPNKAAWTTPGNATITANGVTVDFAGPVNISLSANLFGFFVGPADFLFPGLTINFVAFLDTMVFPNDLPEHLLELGAQDNPFSASYVTIYSPLGPTYNDLDDINLVSVETVSDHPVPEGSSTHALLGLGAVFLIAARHVSRGRSRQA